MRRYGCYEHLASGRVGSALEDLTGGYKDKLYLVDGVTSAAGASKQPDIGAAEEISGGVMWARLCALQEGHHLLGAAYKRKYASLGGAPAIDPSNLDEGETLVYPILELRQLGTPAEEGGGQFVKLRNPWKQIGEAAGAGKAREWEGAWGLNAPEWQNLPGVAQELGGKPRDGSFWMRFEDFVVGFNKVYICRLVDSHPWKSASRLHGEFTASTAGGKLAPLPSPGSAWRLNPQYTLEISARGTIIVAVSQPDALLDANDALDGYPNAIGFTILSADLNGPTGARRLLLPPAGGGELRFDSRLGQTRQVSAVLELDAGQYVVIPYTAEPNTFQPYSLSAAATSPVTLAPLPPSDAAGAPLVLKGGWDRGLAMAGGCPNAIATWTQNPQFALRVDGACSAVAVLSLALDDEAAEAMEDEVHRYTFAAQEAALRGDARAEADAQAALEALAPAIGFLVVASEGGALSGAREISPGEIVASSSYIHGTQEVAGAIELPAAGSYVLIATTFEEGHEARFGLTIYPTSGPRISAKPLTKGCEVIDSPMSSLVSRADGARPQGRVGPRATTAVPKAKVDVASVRASEDGDDGKMGYAQRMEIEEAAALQKWPENLPLMTIEGQPLSENVKKEKERLVNHAMRYCWQTGGKFEDSGPGGFPSAAGGAEGQAQPEVYNKGVPCAGMPVVTQWRRPEEFCPAGGSGLAPTFYKSMFEIEGIIQGAGMDNRWFISALNIVAANRGQLDRIFFGEIDPTWVAYGFFVCKFYQDDPLSDDDWAVVLVDDRIPCDAAGNPAFCRHPDPNVYWAMIIEKAYAKFAGTYQAMVGGTVVQGLEDLTGGIGYKFRLETTEKVRPLRPRSSPWPPLSTPLPSPLP